MAFSYVRNSRSLLKGYSFFIMLLICSLKFKYESIVIPSSVTDEIDFVVISPIYDVCESLFPKIINWNLPGFAFIAFN